MSLSSAPVSGAPKGLLIPPQPKVLMELHRMLESNADDTPGIARLIASDPGVTTLLFKAARSSVFGGGTRKCDTLEQALVVLGTRRAQNLIAALTVSRGLSGERQRDLEIFWTRAGEIAHFAALLAAEHSIVARVSTDQAYLAGMFHECGVPVLMMRFPDYCKNIDATNPACWTILAAENARFNVDHCSVGFLVARHWSLPDYVISVIQNHLEANPANITANYNAVALIQLARQFYFRLSNVDNPLWSQVRQPVLAELGIHLDGEQEYFDEISERFLERQI